MAIASPAYFVILSYGVEPKGEGLRGRKKEESKAKKVKQTYQSKLMKT
jgi:hypothetical protein